MSVLIVPVNIVENEHIQNPVGLVRVDERTFQGYLPWLISAQPGGYQGEWIFNDRCPLGVLEKAPHYLPASLYGQFINQGWGLLDDYQSRNFAYHPGFYESESGMVELGDEEGLRWYGKITWTGRLWDVTYRGGDSRWLEQVLLAHDRLKLPIDS